MFELKRRQELQMPRERVFSVKWEFVVGANGLEQEDNGNAFPICCL